MGTICDFFVSCTGNDLRWFPKQKYSKRSADSVDGSSHVTLLKFIRSAFAGQSALLQQERFRIYSSAGAPTGQEPAHAPQLMQVSLSISNFPSPSEIAPTGHAPAHAPQLMQVSLITYAIALSSYVSELCSFFISAYLPYFFTADIVSHRLELVLENNC